MRETVDDTWVLGLDLVGCGRGLLFEWIWLTVSGFELVRVELVVLVR